MHPVYSLEFFFMSVSLNSVYRVVDRDNTGAMLVDSQAPLHLPTVHPLWLYTTRTELPAD